MDTTAEKTAQPLHLCKNCENHFQGNYCNHCGQKLIENRNTLKHFFHLLFSSLDFNRGLLFTMKQLFVDPGRVINEYLNGRTKDYINPLKYLFIFVGISTLLSVWSNLFDSSISTTNELLGVPNESTDFQNKILTFLKKYLNIFTILFIPFYSIISKWVLKKHKQYYAEHLIINSYLYGHFALINLFPLLLIIAFPFLINYIQFVGILIFIIYYTYALRSIYNLNIFHSALKAIIINFIGLALIMITSMLLMIIVIIFLKLAGANLESLLTK